MGVCIGFVQTVHFRAHTVTPLQGLEDVCQHVAVDLVHIVRFRETDALRKVNVLSPPTELTRGVFRRADIESAPTVVGFIRRGEECVKSNIVNRMNRPSHGRSRVMVLKRSFGITLVIPQDDTGGVSRTLVVSF